jgi:membrane associated rhomboid family serine protease
MLTEIPDLPEPWIAVTTTADERSAAELGLVLTARGIEQQRVHTAVGWELLVRASRARAARAELDAYRAENVRPSGQRRVDTVGQGWHGAAVYAIVLLAVFAALHASLLGLDWLTAGRLDAGRVVAGEWWRVVTALTVHVDLDHVLGNVAFGAFFGYFAARYFGYGVGWLAILGSAAIANLLTALTQVPEHRSIGASTAVFAALGMLTAFTWRRGFLRGTYWRARIAPIIAGIGLLAFTGTGGENTDIGAHFAGFVMGFCAGLLLARFARPTTLRVPGLQALCAAVAAAVLLGAWLWGLVAAG